MCVCTGMCVLVCGCKCVGVCVDGCLCVSVCVLIPELCLTFFTL